MEVIFIIAACILVLTVPIKGASSKLDFSGSPGLFEEYKKLVLENEENMKMLRLLDEQNTAIIMQVLSMRLPRLHQVEKRNRRINGAPGFISQSAYDGVLLKNL